MNRKATKASKASEQPETPSQLGKHNARWWLREIEAAKSRNQDWYESAEKAEERYRDEDRDGFGALNILWANVETQKAAIGEDFGVPEVTRVNAPEDDEGLTRHVANIWGRAVAAAAQDDDDNHDLSLAVGDLFLPGRGVVWLEVDADEDTRGKVRWAKAPLVRVPYREYLQGKASRWGSIPWHARRHEFTLDDLQTECKMSLERAKKVPLTQSCDVQQLKGECLTQGDKDQFKRAVVWEIWTKIPGKYRIYVAEDYPDDVLCCDPDPYSLKDFFPLPRPLLANGDEGWQRPLTDYSRYRDQAAELDRVCERIFILTDLLRVRGVRDASVKELSDVMLAMDNTFVGVSNWAELQAKGGIVAAIQAIDITPLVAVIEQLKMQRRDLIELIYELSGISDLARGMTDPNETLGAQNLKKSFGSGRFRMREDRSREFAAEAYSLKGEVIAEMFPREQLQEMCGIALPLRAEIEHAKKRLETMQQEEQRKAQIAQALQQKGVQVPPPPPPAIPPEELKKLQKLAATRWAWEDVEGVLKSDYRRCYRVRIETDQSKFKDEAVDQANRTAFFNVVMTTFEKVGPMIAGNPKAGEIWKNLIMFVVSSFRAGRSLEEGLELTIDEAIKKATEAANQPQQQDPKTQAEMAKAQASTQVAQINMQTAQIRLQTEQLKQQGVGSKAAEEAQKAQIKAVEGEQKIQQTQTKAQLDAAAGAQKLMQQQQLNAAKAEGQQIELINKKQQLAFEATEQATAREMRLRDGQVERHERTQDRAADRADKARDRQAKAAERKPGARGNG